MSWVPADGISVAFGDRDILSNVGLRILAGDRIALTGANGSGKSTLMKILAGLQSPDAGTVSTAPAAGIAYLPQSGIEYRNTTPAEEAGKAFRRLSRLAEEKRETEEQLSEYSTDAPGLEQLIHRRHELEESLLRSGYYEREERIERVLFGLGFLESDLHRPVSEFSGGWQMRLALSKILLENPDVLLLDEPTNYLDIEARNWLEEYLGSVPAGVMIVSHDRYFLDVTVTETLEVFQGELLRYSGNYSQYEKRRAEELKNLVTAYETQRQEIERIEAFIQRFRYNQSKARLVQSRIKYLEKIEPIVIPENLKKIRIDFPPPPHSGKRVLAVDGLSKRYGQTPVFTDLSLSLTRGERLVIVGRNGAGKSTLMRLIAGVDTEYEGELRYGSGVKIGYFSQDHATKLNPASTVLEIIENSSPPALVPKARDMLGSFLFRGDDVFKQVGVLSGGEKSRLSLLKLLLDPANLLILDEPTNHLDMHSKDILCDALERYTGTLLFVSHDRYFIDRLGTRVLELGIRGPRLFYGDYEYYLWKIGQEEQSDGIDGVEKSNTIRQSDPSPPPEPSPTSATVAVPKEVAGDSTDEVRKKRPDSGLPSSILVKKGEHGPPSREEQKRLRGKYRTLRRTTNERLQEIERLEQKRVELNHTLALPEVYMDGASVKKVRDAIEELDRRIEDASKEWERLESEIERLPDFAKG